MSIVQGDYLLPADVNGPYGNAIYLVEGLGADTASLRVTANCVPIGNAKTVPFTEADKAMWVTVTDLVFAANSAILPKREIKFASPTASMYRHIVPTHALQALAGEDAVDKICFIGQRENGRMKLTNVARYVTGYTNGYYAVFDGFCSGTEQKEHTLKISQFRGMQLFSSSPIVEAANSMYEEDCQLGEKYSVAIKASVAKSTDIPSTAMPAPSLNTLRV